MLKNRRMGLALAAVATLALAGASPADPQSRPGDKKNSKAEQPPPFAGSWHESWTGVPLDPAAARGLRWLLNAQGPDGGWGQDGGHENRNAGVGAVGNDVANTSLACLAILRSGLAVKDAACFRALTRGIEFVLYCVEHSPAAGLTVTSQRGTQIQGKLGPNIDTFLSSLLLSELDGRMADKGGLKRVHDALGKVLAKIEKNQSKDGSWNEGGGWAPIIGTSFASRSLYTAQQKGNTVSATCLMKIDSWTSANFDPTSKTFKSDQGAGVELYVAAQALEQANRGKGFDANVRKPVATGAAPSTPAEGEPPAPENPAEPAAPAAAPVAEDLKAQMRAVATEKLTGAKFLEGFGSMGGEEFVSYLIISDSLVRASGKAWTGWNGRIKERLVKLQNGDGTWAGHHCITGRVACTSAAVTTLLAERGAPKP